MAAQVTSATSDGSATGRDAPARQATGRASRAARDGCPASSWRRGACRACWPTASTGAGGPGRARASGSSVPSSPARPPRGSTGAARPGTTGSTCASANGRRPTTIWLWIDRSASMGFASDLASAPKVERALVLGLALADAFVEGGERVGLLGLTRAERLPGHRRAAGAGARRRHGRPRPGPAAPGEPGPLRRGGADRRFPRRARPDRRTPCRASPAAAAAATS